MGKNVPVAMLVIWVAIVVLLGTRIGVLNRDIDRLQIVVSNYAAENAELQSLIDCYKSEDINTLSGLPLDDAIANVMEMVIANDGTVKTDVVVHFKVTNKFGQEGDITINFRRGDIISVR